VDAAKAVVAEDDDDVVTLRVIRRVRDN